MTDKEQRAGVSHSEIDADTAGQRLDNYLMTRLKGVPRSHVYQLIRSGQVRVNSGRVRPHYRLKAGDSVRVPPVRRRAAPALADPGTGLAWLAERIVFEDDRLLVVDKPAGLAVHGGSGLDFGLIEGLRSLRPGLETLELVHRLDRATSGCIMVAKRRSALRRLHALLREGSVTKRYLALVAGRWEHGEIEIDTPLAVSRDGSAARVRPDASGKAALSVFRLVNQYGDLASLVEVEIRTGRTHQIRVHAAEAGHPIAGDDRYGDRDFNSTCETLGLRRMFLHAQLIEFVWPDSDEEFIVSTPLPDELRRFLHKT
ncbi:MAG TPA: RluA family pseudouridine synthase [Gammaproteobacteria bacterium]|nr:RluA family pseudouridine synthase [Gammaproteobacteria bacterium]